MGESKLPQPLPGKGFFGWLGRQVGHLTRAVKSDPLKTILHREERTEEARLPDAPNVKLRRTVIDEVIVERPDEGTGRGRPGSP